MDTQIIELVGRNRLISELLQSGLEVALPLRDRGIDLIAYADLNPHEGRFIARPIQMKAASKTSFSIERKYEKFQDLILAYIWELDNPDKTVSYALTYSEAIRVGEEMGYTATDSWVKKGKYANTRPGRRLCNLLEPHRMTLQRWRQKVISK